MGSFGGKRWRAYLDQEAQKIRDQKLDHLKRNYSGPSDFVKKQLKEEEVLSLEQKIEKVESEIEEKKSDLQKFRQIKRQREQQDKLRDKKELLKEKQKKLRTIQRNDVKSEEEVLADAAHQILARCEDKASKESVDEDRFELFGKDRYQRRVDRLVEKRSVNMSRVDDLVESVQRLQNQVADLNGGPEDWFLELDKVEVSA